MPRIRGGYQGRLLQADLTNGKLETKELTAALAWEFLGGPGIGARLLYEGCPPGADPLGPDNPLILMTGPLVGTELPGAVNFSLVTKGTAGYAVATNSNGNLGRALKFSGYDGMIFQGSSPGLVYLLVEDGRAELKDAAELGGRDLYETTDWLMRKHPGASVGCIGIAGEQKVHFAAFLSDKRHSASKGGVGAILGAKRVKAIVIKPSAQSIGIADEARMKDIIQKWIQMDDKHGLGKIVKSRGGIGFFNPLYELGIVPVKNLTTNDFPEHERYRYEAFSRQFKTTKGACPTCSFNHFNYLYHEGEELKEPSCFDTLCGFGPNIGITDPIQTVKLTTLVDRLGLEAQEASWLLSLIMECFEAGILKPNDLDGLELRWGNYPACVTLLHKIARQEGCGALFAQGIYQAAGALGSEALKRAVYVKRGGVPQLMDIRNNWPHLFGEAVSNLSSRETTANTYEIFADNEEGLDYPQGWEIAGIPDIIPKHHYLVTPRTQLPNILGLCQYHGATDWLRLVVDALNAATGMGFELNQVLLVSRRYLNLMRLFNVLNGHSSEDDTVSARLLSAPVGGLNAGKNFAPHLEKIKKRYYQKMGWDQKGVPRSQTLEYLGLGWAIPNLEQWETMSVMGKSQVTGDSI